MSVQVPFYGSLLKVKWANKHIEQFNRVLDGFSKMDFYTIAVERDGDTGKSALNIRIKPLPVDLSLIVGDAFHNLRSALDLAYVELVTRIGKEPGSWTSFRVWENRQKLIDTLSKGIMQGADDIVSMLADRVKCYSGGNSLISVLDSLDIADKHCLIIPMLDMGAVRDLGIALELPEGAGHAAIERTDGPFAYIPNQPIRVMTVPAGSKCHINHNGKASVSALFGEVAGLKGQPIVPTFHQLSQLVLEIIQIFTNALVKRGSLII